MKLIWTRTAGIDRKKIHEYIAQDNFSSALKFDKILSKR